MILSVHFSSSSESSISSVIPTVSFCTHSYHVLLSWKLAAIFDCASLHLPHINNHLDHITCPHPIPKILWHVLFILWILLNPIVWHEKRNDWWDIVNRQASDTDLTQRVAQLSRPCSSQQYSQCVPSRSILTRTYALQVPESHAPASWHPRFTMKAYIELGAIVEVIDRKVGNGDWLVGVATKSLKS